MNEPPRINTGQADDLLIRAPEHKEAEDDDCGLPEHPIYSNYAKYMWQSHSRNKRMRTLSRAAEGKNGNKNIG